MNITCAVRVAKEEVAEEIAWKHASKREHTAAHIIGAQDYYVDLRRCSQVPEGWAGVPGLEEMAISDTVTVLVATIFGAIHCIAWHTLQSSLEQLLWRLASITIIAVPLTMYVVFWIICFASAGRVPIFLTIVIYPGVLMALLYVTARMILVVISLTSLRNLPVSAYQTIEWTTFFPHF